MKEMKFDREIEQEGAGRRLGLLGLEEETKR
jgi:hypothetical protein